MGIVNKISSKLSRQTGYLHTDIKQTLGINHAFYSRARGGRIINYHGICKHSHLRYNTIFLQLKTFETHLKFYKKYCSVISLHDFYEQRFNPDKFNICLTFDDGFANNYKYVLPLLEQYQMPATFFITAISNTGHDVLWNDFLAIVSKHGPQSFTYKNEQYVKNRHGKYISKVHGIGLADQLRSTTFDDKANLMKQLYQVCTFKEMGINQDYWLQMTGQQIRELSASPFATIGAHGYYHNDLARIPIEDAVDEMSRSKQYLENLINKPVTSLAFPYGTYTPQLVRNAKQIGYNQLLALDFLYPEDSADASLRERFTVNPFISVANQMHATLKGSYGY
jgi:peptidoglycan/xylan/chitin deacetylase (PgdA/CDA1 family)